MNPVDIIFRKEAADLLITEINELPLSQFGTGELGDDIYSQLSDWRRQIPTQYMDRIIVPCVVECKTALSKSLPEQIKKLFVQSIQEAAKPYSRSISLHDVVKKFRSKHVAEAFRVCSVVSYTPKFDPRRPLNHDLQDSPVTVGSSMPAESAKEQEEVANAVICIKGRAFERAQAIEECAIAKITDIFKQLDVSEKFLPFFEMSEAYHGFKGLHRPLLLKLLKDEMEKYVDTPEVYKVYEATISVFRDKPAIVQKDFEEMALAFARQDMQTQAKRIEEINRSAASPESIPLTGGDLEKVITRIKAKENYGMGMLLHEKNIKDEASRIYRNRALEDETMWQDGYNERCTEWVEKATAKTKQFIDTYAEQFLAKLLDFLQSQQSVTLHDVRLTIRTIERENSTVENDDFIVRKPREVVDYILYEMVNKIVNAVILEATA